MTEKEIQKEIKKILGGSVILKEGYFEADNSPLLIGLQGAPNGVGSMMLAGLYKEEAFLELTTKNQEAKAKAVKVLNCMGKPCRLQSFPEAHAVIRRSGFENPQLILLEQADELTQLTIYTPRSITAKLNCARILKDIGKQLPEYAVLEK